jgi:hypothetical protein
MRLDFSCRAYVCATLWNRSILRNAFISVIVLANIYTCVRTLVLGLVLGWSCKDKFSDGYIYKTRSRRRDIWSMMALSLCFNLTLLLAFYFVLPLFVTRYFQRSTFKVLILFYKGNPFIIAQMALICWLLILKMNVFLDTPMFT